VPFKLATACGCGCGALTHRQQVAPLMAPLNLNRYESFLEGKAAELLGIPMMRFHKERQLESSDAVAHQ